VFSEIFIWEGWDMDMYAYLKTFEIKLTKDEQEKVQMFVEYLNNYNKQYNKYYIEDEMELDFETAVKVIFMRGLECMKENGQLT